MPKAPKSPNLWSQFDLAQIATLDAGKLRELVDQLYGPQPAWDRWRLAVMLKTHGLPFNAFAARAL